MSLNLNQSNDLTIFNTVNNSITPSSGDVVLDNGEVVGDQSTIIYFENGNNDRIGDK